MAPSYSFKGKMKVYIFGQACTSGKGEDADDEFTPVLLDSLTAQKIKIIRAGGMHTLAVTHDGQVFSFGVNDEKALGRDGSEFLPGKITGIPKAVQVAAADSLSLALCEDNNLYSWGLFRDRGGALGFNETVKQQPLPIKLECPDFKKKKVISIKTGENHVLALTEDHLLYSWGVGEGGQLGRRVVERFKKKALSPACVTPARSNLKFSIIACGGCHSIGYVPKSECSTHLNKKAKKDQQDGFGVYTWGLNNHGQLGLGLENVNEVLFPQRVDFDEEVEDIVAGEHHTLILTKKGEVYGFGRSDDGALGCSIDRSFKPIKINLPKARLISAKARQSMVVCGDKDLYCFGVNGEGQLGMGDDKDTITKPTKMNFNFGKIIGIECGGVHGVVLSE